MNLPDTDLCLPQLETAQNYGSAEILSLSQDGPSLGDSLCEQVRKRLGCEGHTGIIGH